MVRLAGDVYQKVRGRERRVARVQEAPRAIEGAEIVAAADIDADRVRSFGTTFGVGKTYTDYRELLADDQVDAVFICTPPNLHPSITVEAAAEGKHIFCEKPMALTAAECTRMIEATRDASVNLQIGYVLRFSSDVRTIRDSVLRGDIGRPVLWRQVMNLAAGADVKWVHDFNVGRGVLWEDSHYLDFMIHVLGNPATVYALGGRFKPEKTTAPDAVVLAITFKAGDKALFTHSYSLPGFGLGKTSLRRNWAQIDIIGPGGYIQFPDRSMADVLTIIRYTPEGEVASPHKWESDWGANGYRDELVHFVQSVREGKPTQTSGEGARKTVVLLEGALESMNTGEACHLNAFGRGDR
jgi:predicted dehydrogenase